MRVRSLSIQDFRGFHCFEMKDLGRINLIVGTNNSGKTTVLEAVNILMAYGNATAISAALVRRGEVVWEDRQWQADVQRLFYGHCIEIGTVFRLSAGQGGGNVLDMTAEIREQRAQREKPSAPSPPPPIESTENYLSPRDLFLGWWSEVPPQECATSIPISRGGGLGFEEIRRASRVYPGYDFPLQFATSSSMSTEVVTSLFEKIVLTPEEDLVIDALRIIEPSIERVASARPERFLAGSVDPPRSSIYVRLKGFKDRIPIGSMGDGIWRMLGLALNVVHSRDGILLIDEIDTGLHHTVMDEMWRFLYATARRYSVQVFATTHSRDCYESLAAIADSSVSDKSDVTIQRIERGREEAVGYSEQTIVAAAKHGYEVR